MNDSLKIGLAQANLIWENKAANLAKFEYLLNGDFEVDLVLLPEMFTTGFSMNPEKLFDNPEGETLQWMQAQATKLQAAICGSAIIKVKKQFFNRLFFVFPSGEYRTYDKRHLFTLAGEEKVYSPGNQQLVLEFKGWKIMPLICYDLRFPVWCRNTENVDLQIFVANWPQRRAEAWTSLLKARAIENMCYTAGLNRVGNDGNEVYHSGNSEVFDELGNSILSFPKGEEALKIVELNRKKMLKSRERFGFLNDRDHFALS